MSSKDGRWDYCITRCLASGRCLPRLRERSRANVDGAVSTADKMWGARHAGVSTEFHARLDAVSQSQGTRRRAERFSDA